MFAYSARQEIALHRDLKCKNILNSFEKYWSLRFYRPRKRRINGYNSAKGHADRQVMRQKQLEHTVLENNCTSR
jgi:hypothetical protein